MREILFRGFHECENGTKKAYYGGEWHTGKWVYGDLSQHKSGKVFIKPHYQSATNSKEVALETVSQYTGRNDKNGKKIFENDIAYNGYNNDIVVWSPLTNGFRCDSLALCERFLTIIGNKFENPELVEVK